MLTRDYIQEIALTFEGRMRKAFLDSMNNISKKIDVDRIADIIRTGHIESAVQLIDISDADFVPLRETTASAISSGGRATIQTLPAVLVGGQRIKISFNPGSRRAMEAVDNLHTHLIREIGESTRDAIRTRIRTGLEFGTGPREIARSIRGKYDYVAKQYRGGVIGLTKHQEGWVTNAERQLRSGDPREMRKYLKRKLRDRRHDRQILTAINEGVPLNEATVRNATDSYRRRAVKYRAEVIARDQAIEALSVGQNTAVSEFLGTGAVQERDILQFWIDAGDARVRDAHAMVPGMNAGGVRRGEMFETPLGPLLRPRDRSSPGSSAANTIQCRCSLSIRVRRQ